MTKAISATEDRDSGGQEQAVKSTVKKVRCDKPISFRRKVHCKQFDFNKRVVGCLEKAADEITK